MTDPFADDGRPMHERMAAGDFYIAEDPVLGEMSMRAATLQHRLNVTTDPNDHAEIGRLLAELFGTLGESAWVRPPLHVDYGSNLHIGDRTFANFGLTVLDVAEIRIGADCQIGPNVQLLTAIHPVDPGPRRDKWEAGAPITIGDNVWLGGGAIVLAGVTIGENSIIGAGAVVNRNIPANVVAVGSPARVVKHLADGPKKA